MILLASTPVGPRRAAWTVLASGLALLLALSAQAARHGWTPPAAIAPVAPARTAPAPMAVAQNTVLPVTQESAAPAAGTTGTIALPALPAAALAAPAAADLGVTPAAPFRVGHAATQDRTRALECLTAAVYYEAASESDAGQQAVAQVVLNRVRHPAFPATVCGVVYQGAEHAGCQFSFACDGSIQRHLPSAGGWARAARVAAAALAGRVYAPVGLATHYHTYAVTPAWNRSLVMTDAVGAHFFHRWKGWWGTAAAFRQIYAGGEPLPGPPPAAPAQPVIAAVAPLPLAAVPPLPSTAVRPAAPAAVRPPSDDRLPPAATVLPRWADSGQALR